MKSYIILGVYGLLAIVFLRWEASIFVMMSSLLIEVGIIMIGLFITGLHEPRKLRWMDVPIISGLPLILLYMFTMSGAGHHFGELETMEMSSHWLTEGYVLYKWELILIAICLGGGYIVDVAKLKASKRHDKFSVELIGVVFLIYGSGLLPGMMVYWMDPEQKWLPMSFMILARMLIEIWYLMQKRKNNLDY